MPVIKTTFYFSNKSVDIMSAPDSTVEGNKKHVFDLLSNNVFVSIANSIIASNKVELVEFKEMLDA